MYFQIIKLDLSRQVEALTNALELLEKSKMLMLLV